MTSLALCTTLRAPYRQTMEFVRYHVDAGVDRLYLFFDDPRDPALRALGDEPRVSAVACDEAHWSTLSPLPRSELSLNAIQRLNSVQAIERARQEGMRWLAHIDSDELIYSPSGIKKQIARAPDRAQVIKLASHEVVPSGASNIAGFPRAAFFRRWHPTRPRSARMRRLFRLAPAERVRLAGQTAMSRAKIRLAQWRGCARPFSGGYLKAHVGGKSITRVDGPVSALDCHYPSVTRPVVVWLFSGISVLHYDALDYEQWRSKWIARYEGSARVHAEREMKPERLRQYRRFVELYSQGRDQDLRDWYRDLVQVTDADRDVLVRLGLLTWIEIPERAFSAGPGV